MSILSFPDRGHWGDSRYRGNCSGYVYKNLFEQLRPSVFVDPMMGSGTSIEVATEMGIEAYGLDLHSGFNVLRDSIRAAVGKESDLCVSHPPYFDVIHYSGNMWGTPHPDDLSRCESIEDFYDKLQVALLNQREATRPGGYFGIIIGDIRSRGQYFSPQAEMCARLPRDELRAIIIKGQHNVQSASRQYPGMRLPRILHEYVVLWERPAVIRSLLGSLSVMAQQHDRRLKATWKSVVQAALIELGGTAPLPALYEKIAESAPEKVRANEHWKEKVRQVLQVNQCVFEPQSRGVWRQAA